MANIFPIDFEEKLTMAQDDYILFSDSEDWNKIKKAQYKNLKWEKGDTWPAWKDGTDGKDWTDWESATITVGSTSTLPSWSSATVTNSWTSSAAVLNFGIPQWPKGEDGKDGTDGKDWVDWKDGADWAAATITVWSTTTGNPWTSASVVNSWTSSAAVLDFTIPQWATWATGNGIASITSSKAWKITTVTITETNSTVDTFQISDGADWQWSGDVVWPASSTDWDIVLFDWATWKIIKDSWVWLSSKLDASALSDNNYWWAWENDSTHTPTKRALYDKIHTMDVEIWNKAADNTVVKLTWNQTINWTKTFWTSPVVPSKTSAATNTWTAIATEAQVKLVADDVATINWKIPSAATSSNQLADKNYVDDSINSVTAYYITKNAQGDQWATYAELAAASTFYSGWVQRTPTKNDYTIVLDDENHDNATTRYIYNSGWEYQYTVNETALTQAQLDALNSWITSGKVSTYDGYATTISWKQDALTLPATPTQWNLVTWWANNKTLVDGWAIPTVPTNVSTFNNDAWYLTSATWVTSVNWQHWAVTWLLTAETVVSGDSGTTYTIKVSSSAPWAWTPNTTITFVTA